MDKRQRNFLIIASSVVALFVLVLVILSTLQNRAVPAPVTPPVPSATVVVTPAASGTPTPPGVSPTPTVSMSPSPAVTGTPGAVATARAPQTFYVAPNGTDQGDGSQARPWPLQYVLDQRPDIRPGDTVLLQAGQYTGPFTSWLHGEKDHPITLRAAPGARVTLQSSDLVLDIANSAYVNFMDLEITATQNNRDPKNPNESAYGVRINQGKASHDIKFINLIVHDMPAQGFGWWQANVDSEIYGCLVYYNGTTQFDHGIYIHNTDGAKTLADSIIFDNASHGIHAYGEKEYQKLNNITIEGNTVFDNGSIGFNTSTGVRGGFKRNILIGGLLVAENPVIKDNYTYYPDGSSGVSFNLGYRAGTTNAVVEDNYFAGGLIEMGGLNADVTMLKNTILGTGITALSSFGSGQNDLLLLKPKDTRIFVRPNQYEPGRANITVYNWAKQNQVTLSPDDLKGVQIKPGDHYELHNVQDYFTDIVTGTYDGSQMVIPMTGHTVAQPLGLNFKPNSTFPEFGAFVLIVTPGN